MEGLTMQWGPDAQQETEVSLVDLFLDHWVHWMQVASSMKDARQKVLVPLDGTAMAARVLVRADKLLDYGGEGILLHVIPTKGKAPASSDCIPFDRSSAMEYLTEIAGQLGQGSGRWRCQVIEAPSIADAISSYAAREGVDLIAIKTQERKGLAKLTKPSIARKIQQRSTVEVKVFRSSELGVL